MKKLNNKGFSLVELIIVIAIMAILVGVVGTQVIPYLENSRKAKDQQVLSAWNTAAMSAYSNAAAKVDANCDYTLTITLNDTSTTLATSHTNGSDALDGETSIKNYFIELTNITSFKRTEFESKSGKAISQVEIEINHNGGMTLKTTTAVGNFDVIESK